ncbi:iron ABC transporter substrate-binding protein [Pasteurellaceae bacterium RH1A]|nr:iron ABC transporter substrate-binding protein [Pasteurellaceae bacterium RH1A]
MGTLFVLLSLLTGSSLTQAKSIATLDWTVAETLVALGEEPLAVGDLAGYDRWVKEPKLATQFDLGLRNQPNPEQILALQTETKHQPLHFINSSFYAANTPILEKFAQVKIVDFYKEGDSWLNVLAATQEIADYVGKLQAAQQLIADFSQKMAQLKPLVAPFTDRPIALVQFADSRHLRIYAKNSPFGAILDQLGFENAWQGSHNMWGTENIEVTQLAKLPAKSRLVVVKPYPANIGTALKYNTLWQHLPLAQDPLVLPAVWTFGGLPSALRFAEVLSNGLQNGGEAW